MRHMTLTEPPVSRIVLGSQYNECQRLCHGKTKHVPVHDVPDQNSLILPFAAMFEGVKIS